MRSGYHVTQKARRKCPGGHLATPNAHFGLSALLFSPNRFTVLQCTRERNAHEDACKLADFSIMSVDETKWRTRDVLPHAFSSLVKQIVCSCNSHLREATAFPSPQIPPL